MKGRTRTAGEGRRYGGSVHKGAGFQMCRKQPFDLRSNLGVGACVQKKRTAFFLRSLERSMKQRLEVSPPSV